MNPMQHSQDSASAGTVINRARSAGCNRMEILLFTLGSGEIFGINVFKVREVSKAPKITPTPYAPRGVEGVISLRGHVIPVIDLAAFVAPRVGAPRGATMLVTEFSRHTQGFLVEAVDRIVRVDWDQVKQPEDIVAAEGNFITALTRLPDGRLVSILDVEQVLAVALGEPTVPELVPLAAPMEGMLFFADDSGTARRMIVQVLERLGARYQQARNGAEAYARLKAMADQAERQGMPLKRELKLVLTDAEMPEMDGYALTRQLRADTRFDGVPVIMHSSLSSSANRALGQSVGVDAYVSKFDPTVLADTLRPYLSR